MNFRARSAIVAVVIGVIAIHAIYAAQPVPQRVISNESAIYLGYSKGEIKRIDTDLGTVTLKHGPIENLGMPDMTMIFRMAQPGQVVSFKVGDRVRFKAEKIKGSLVITELVSLK